MAHLDDGAGREEVDGARDVGEVALGRREELDVEEKSHVSLRDWFVKVGKKKNALLVPEVCLRKNRLAVEIANVARARGDKILSKQACNLH